MFGLRWCQSCDLLTHYQAKKLYTACILRYVHPHIVLYNIVFLEVSYCRSKSRTIDPKLPINLPRYRLLNLLSIWLNFSDPAVTLYTQGGPDEVVHGVPC